MTTAPEPREKEYDEFCSSTHPEEIIQPCDEYYFVLEGRWLPTRDWEWGEKPSGSVFYRREKGTFPRTVAQIRQMKASMAELRPSYLR